ncbi:UDP-4-amino-4,6-dideoxy-N-acetyl-beta-L-altrosamine N-acetyltransferase [Marinobacter sp. F4218]|uniref:UDP-4-amino-4, 6-dideoxy-N-acetyl-beta-L-altrosamine N-acetyltransferase n=1 Tax=Marinobacter sp. F4218 TaxID=2862868 RepID=UPI002B480761|nr:UDP-4-amino-4,6-dideoxy-N-acetyl-beta-L-altrosamine N-acetyltransferase [Marinobacter sp. F4218]
MKTGELRPMVSGDLDRVLAWRNHPDVRRYMYSSHEIAPDEHKRWFEGVQKEQGVSLLIYELDGIPCGFVNISETRWPAIADWGFYLAPDARSGTGRGLGQAALGHAFGTMKLHKLCGQAIGFNERSIRFHRALGFTLEGTLRDQFFDGEQYHDIVCFGILASEWQNSNS